jgi:hypothetical protein
MGAQDHALPLPLARGKEIGEPGAERRENLLQRGNGGADAIGFDHRDRGVGDARPPRQLALREPEAQPQLPQTLADLGVLGRTVHVFDI